MTAGENGRIVNEFIKNNTFTGIEIRENEVIFWSDNNSILKKVTYAWIENNEVIFSEHSREYIEGEPTYQRNARWNYE